MSQKTKYAAKILVVPLVLLLLLVLVGNFAGSLEKLKDTARSRPFSLYKLESAAERRERGKIVTPHTSLFSRRVSPITGNALSQETLKSLSSEEIEALAYEYRNNITAAQNFSGSRVRSVNLKPSSIRLTRQTTGENKNGVAVEVQHALNEPFPAFLRTVLQKGDAAQTNKITDETVENPFTKALRQTAEGSATKEILDGQDLSRPVLRVHELASRPSLPSPPVFRFFGDIDHSHRVRVVEGNPISEGTFGLIGYGVASFDLAVNPKQLALRQSVTIGDINNDRILDLVVAEKSNNIVRVFLGMGGNWYQEVSSLRIGFGVSSVSLGDFNNDGNLDLVVTSTGYHNVAILLGDGTGAFTYFTDFRGPDHTTAILVDDVNGDGISDLMLLDLSARAFRTFLGDGTGNFIPADLNPSLTGLSVPIPDIHLDGRDCSIELLQLGHSVSINANYGQGEVQNIINYINFPNFFTVLGDFSGDGHMDFAIGILLNLTKG